MESATATPKKEVPCACECGEDIQKSRPWHKFIDDNHRNRYHADLRRKALVKYRAQMA